MFCLNNRVPISYELTPANVAEVGLALELLAEALAEANIGNGFARESLEDLAYRSGRLKEALVEAGILLVTEQVERRGARQQVEIAFRA